MTWHLAGLRCVRCGGEDGPWGREAGGLVCESCIGTDPQPLTDLERARAIAVALEQENAALRSLFTCPRCIDDNMLSDGAVTKILDGHIAHGGAA